MASSLLEESQFSTAFKCSAHLSRIFDRSVINVNESELRRVLVVYWLVDVTLTKGPVCYTCDRLPHPWDCDTVAQCNSHEECFVEQSVTVSGKIVYTSGCASQTKCSNGRRQIQSYNNIADVIDDVTSLEDDVVTCTQCCNDTNYCNHELCDNTGQTPHPAQQYCLYCPNVVRPEDCEHVVLCNIDEICFTEFVMLNGEQRYRLGCSPRKSCDQTNIRQTFPQLIGRRRDLLVDVSPYCGSCCDGVNCNRNLCAGTNNSGPVYDLVTSPPRSDSCADISTLDCLDDIKLNNSVCTDPRYYNYACRQACGTCAQATSKPPIDPSDCFYDSGRYMGQRSTTLLGKQCIRWSDVGRNDAMLANADNHCRDPDGRGYPWCYVTPDMDWEYCQVPYCQECHFAGRTRDYMGYVSKDMNGQSCLPWIDYINQPNSTGIVDSMFPDGSASAASNHCRDIFGYDTILCYIGNHTLSQCDVPTCSHECRDSQVTDTNCGLVQQFLCKNEYLSITLCPKTCNKCSFGLLPEVIVVPEETCVDRREANCVAIANFVCQDPDASISLCPRTCRRCQDIFPTTAAPALSTLVTSQVTSSPAPTFSTSQTTLIIPTKETTTPTQGSTTEVPTTSTIAPASWLPWAEWTCTDTQASCYHVRFRNCSNNDTMQCRQPDQTKPYEIVYCTNKTTCAGDTCMDFNNVQGTNGCEGDNLEFICAEKAVAWRTCRKSCNLCDTCWDYLDCNSWGAQTYFCRNETLATQYCRKSCNLCANKPVDVSLSKCGDPVSNDAKCAELQKTVCICSDNDLLSLCKNFCENRCVDYPLTDELRNCTPLAKKRRDLVLSQILLE